MERDAIYIIPLLNSETTVYKVNYTDKIKLTPCNESLKYHERSASKIYAIQKIEENTIKLLDNHGEKKVFAIEKIAYPLKL